MLFLAFFDQTLHVARVSNQHHAGAPLKEAAQSGQRKDVIERKRCHNDFGLLLEVAGNPNTRLLQVGQHIAVREHGAFGNAGCAACVLQKCDVIAVELDRIKFSGSALGECVAERDSVFEIELGHHLLYFLQHEVNEQTLRSRKQVADLSRDDVFNGRIFLNLFKRLGEVLDDDQDLSAGILQLSAELAGGVKRIDVDDDKSGFHDAEQTDRILEKVRHHHGNAVALLDARERLQIRSKRRHFLIKFFVRHCLAQAGKDRSITVLLTDLFLEIRQ